MAVKPKPKSLKLDKELSQQLQIIEEAQSILKSKPMNLKSTSKIEKSSLKVENNPKKEEIGVQSGVLDGKERIIIHSKKNQIEKEPVQIGHETSSLKTKEEFNTKTEKEIENAIKPPLKPF